MRTRDCGQFVTVPRLPLNTETQLTSMQENLRERCLSVCSALSSFVASDNWPVDYWLFQLFLSKLFGSFTDNLQYLSLRYARVEEQSSMYRKQFSISNLQRLSKHISWHSTSVERSKGAGSVSFLLSNTLCFYLSFNSKFALLVVSINTDSDTWFLSQRHSDETLVLSEGWWQTLKIRESAVSSQTKTALYIGKRAHMQHIDELWKQRWQRSEATDFF